MRNLELIKNRTKRATIKNRNCHMKLEYTDTFFKNMNKIYYKIYQIKKVYTGDINVTFSFNNEEGA